MTYFKSHKCYAVLLANIISSIAQKGSVFQTGFFLQIVSIAYGINLYNLTFSKDGIWSSLVKNPSSLNSRTCRKIKSNFDLYIQRVSGFKKQTLVEYICLGNITLGFKVILRKRNSLKFKEKFNT